MARQVDNPTPNRILETEGFPGRWEILETVDETGGERFETRMDMDEQGELLQ